MPVGDASPPIDDPLIGRVLADRYRILRKIGEGGMGCVYQAEHALIEKKIALKVLFQDLTRRPDLVARFLQEAKSASRIGHENVIDISDFGQSAEGLVFIAMEYLDGRDLGKMLKAERSIPWARTRPILMQIVKALRAAHASGVIHRDMKPENVYLVQREGRPDFVKVLDFGIAKIVNPDENDGPRLTQTGMIFGTPEYMSPEQAQGSPPDHRVDVYAVGCIMYQMLTGSVPFTADNFMGILTKHLLEAPVPPRQRRPDLEIPADVEQVCLRAMEKDREKRWPDMDAFYRALGAAGGLPFEPSQVFSPPRASLKYPNLAEPSAEARESRTALAAPGPTGTFEDERPGSRGAAVGGVSRSAKVGLAVAAAVLVAAGLAFALRSAHAPASKPAEATAVAPSPPAAPAKVETPTPGEPAKPTGGAPVAPIPAQPASATTVKTETAAEAAPTPAPGEVTAAGKPAHRRHHADEPKADPLHRQIPVPAEQTPAELKNPFSTP